MENNGDGDGAVFINLVSRILAKFTSEIEVKKTLDIIFLIFLKIMKKKL